MTNEEYADATHALRTSKQERKVAPQPAAQQEEAQEPWDDLPKKLIDAARRDVLTHSDRVAIGRAIARIQQAAPKPLPLSHLQQLIAEALAPRSRQPEKGASQ